MVYYDDGKVLVRDMEQGDARQFRDEEVAQGWDADIKKYEMRLADQKSGKAVSVAAEYMGKPAGYINIYPNAGNGAFGGKGYPEIVDFGVLEKYRRLGIGNRLMDIAEEIAGLYADMVYLGVGLHSGYGSAQRMYIKRGYIPDGSGVWYRDVVCGQYEDCRNDDDLVLYLSKQLRVAKRESGERIFMTKISALTPSQLYISQEKLARVQSWFQQAGDIVKMEPIPVRNLAGRLVMAGGHTRAAAAYLRGFRSLPCVWDRDDRDWAAYAADINMCAEEGITSVEKLASRIVSGADYKRLWNGRCDALYDEWYYKVLKQEEEIICFTRKEVPAGTWDIRPFDMETDDEDIEYFQLYHEGTPVARGCIERYSFEFWEAADIRTYEAFRGRGFGMAITAYLTNRIVSAGKTATCRTLPGNVRMARIMEKCGYQKLYQGGRPT